jgi:aspartyl-tRNA(Asn)/glutamyl-tRNA(Gln) amidotransferase subunit B
VELTSKEHLGKEEVKRAVNKVISKEKKALNDFKKGKIQVVSYLIGQVQIQLKGRGEPKKIREILLKKLDLIK